MNPNCPDKLKKLVPLSKVVSASIIDSWEDIGKMQQLFFHWAARGLRKLQTETLKSGRRSVLISVNPNTGTATLPPDFDYELFVGYINDFGERVPIQLKTNLINLVEIEELVSENICDKCRQDKSICNDLTVTESVEMVIVNGNAYEQTTIKKLYPDGSYYLETTIPYWNVTTDTIEFTTTKEFIAKIELKQCGCVETTTENIETIKSCCYEAYCCHFSNCTNVCDTDAGGYKIFEESGLIQFDYRFRHTQVYLEYIGFIPKLNGQYAVPEVAFETLVEWTKFKSIEGKRNISNPDKQWRWNMYTNARKNMLRVMGRISLDNILHIITLTPKFDWTAPSWNNFCPPDREASISITNASLTGCDTNIPICNAVPKLTPFKLAVIVPETEIDNLPVAGSSIWQSDALIGAVNLEWIIVNNNNESKNLGNFSFDSNTGTIDRSPNIFFAGDSIITDFDKLI